ncbi:hypothetical protein CRUP_036986 [Coryphaenoides rupestris]|nr:hypothetical protein CRUP_036986 [Coryphaenoides rupestris]
MREEINIAMSTQVRSPQRSGLLLSGVDSSSAEWTPPQRCLLSLSLDFLGERLRLRVPECPSPSPLPLPPLCMKEEGRGRGRGKQCRELRSAACLKQLVTTLWPLLVVSSTLSRLTGQWPPEEDCEKAFFKMDNVLIDDRRIHVDFSQSVSKIKWKGKGGQYSRDDFKAYENDLDKRSKLALKDTVKPKQDSRYELVLEEEEEGLALRPPDRKQKKQQEDDKDSRRSKPSKVS